MALNVPPANENASSVPSSPPKPEKAHWAPVHPRNSPFPQPLQLLNPNTHGNISPAIESLQAVPAPQCRPASPSGSSSNNEDEFFEASPVLREAISEDTDSVRLHTIRQAFPAYEAVLLSHHGYPSLLETTLVPVIQEHILPHMSGPLLEDDAVLEINAGPSEPILRLVGPLCDLYEHGVDNYSDEGALLQILTDEVEKLEAEESQELEKPWSVLETLRSWLYFKTEENYDEKYPWAKYLRREEGQ